MNHYRRWSKESEEFIEELWDELNIQVIKYNCTSTKQKINHSLKINKDKTMKNYTKKCYHLRKALKINSKEPNSGLYNEVLLKSSRTNDVQVTVLIEVED